MHELTNKDVEKRAVIELANYFEKQIKNVILQSVMELDKQNKLRKIQGLYQKSRIDRACIQTAIKTINSNGYSSMSNSNRTGGKKRKKKKIEKHLPKKDFLTEVMNE